MISDQKLINKKILVRKLEVLKVKPLKNKKLVVLMVEKEYNEPFWLIEPTNKPSSELSTLHKPSIALTSFLEKLIKKIKPDFATEELGMRSLEEFNENNETNDEHEAFKQNLSEVARGYVDNLFCLGSCGDSISVKLRFCRAAVSRRRSSDVDNATI